MKNFLRKISEGKFDESVHSEFIKFSKGRFENRYLIEGKKQKDKWAIKTSAEFSNYLVRKCLEKANSEEIEVKGVIVSTFDITSEVNFSVGNIKKYMGIQQAIIDTVVNVSDVLALMDKYPRVHFGLSFKTENCDLKIKAKAPKSGKPGKKGDDGPKADFCSLKTNDSEMVNDLFFDFPDFKEIKINHTIVIDKIELPKDAKTPEEMRENALREGKVIRIVKIGEDIKESEFEFRA